MSKHGDKQAAAPAGVSPGLGKFMEVWLRIYERLKREGKLEEALAEYRKAREEERSGR